MIEIQYFLWRKSVSLAYLLTKLVLYMRKATHDTATPVQGCDDA